MSITKTEYWIVSVKKLYNLPGYDGLEYLQKIEPFEKIAYSYHVYRIEPLPWIRICPSKLAKAGGLREVVQNQLSRSEACWKC